MNYFVVAAAASVMPEITPIKAHNVDLGPGAFLAVGLESCPQSHRGLRQDRRSPGLYDSANTRNTGLTTGPPRPWWQHGHRGGRDRRDHWHVVWGQSSVARGSTVSIGGHRRRWQRLHRRQLQRDAQLRHGLASHGGHQHHAQASPTWPSSTTPARSWPPRPGAPPPSSDVSGIAVDSSSNVVIAGDVGVASTPTSALPWAPSFQWQDRWLRGQARLPA